MMQPAAHDAALGAPHIARAGRGPGSTPGGGYSESHNSPRSAKSKVLQYKSLVGPSIKQPAERKSGGVLEVMYSITMRLVP